MKELPILFSGYMVRAILDGRKKQTRRIVKPRPYLHPDDDNGWIIDYKKTPYAWPERFFDGTVKCPYGKPGDRLWVRETTEMDTKYETAILSKYSADGEYVLYSGCENQEFNGTVAHWSYPRRVRPSIHMPRWASRIDLEITNIQVERLQDISEEDSIAEGIIQYWPNQFGLDDWEGCYKTAKDAYMFLWELINGSGSWDANPWVWVVEFKRIK